MDRRSSLMHSSQIRSLAGSFMRASSPVGRAFTTPFTRSSNLPLAEEVIASEWRERDSYCDLISKPQSGTEEGHSFSPWV